MATDYYVTDWEEDTEDAISKEAAPYQELFRRIICQAIDDIRAGRKGESRGAAYFLMSKESDPYFQLAGTDPEIARAEIKRREQNQIVQFYLDSAIRELRWCRAA